ncbi:MAG: ABC transporter ATP-binding protein, partial [Bacteroidota bacterium]
FELRNELFKAQLMMPMTIYEKKGIGKYLLRHSGDLKSIQNYLAKGLITFAVDVFLILLLLIALYLLHAPLVLVVVLFLPFLVGLIFYLNKNLHDKSVVNRNNKSGLLSFVSASLNVIVSIKGFNRITPELNKYQKRSGKLLKSGLSYFRIKSLITAIIPGFTYLMLLGILYYVYTEKEAGNTLNAGAMLSAILLLITALPVFRRALRVNSIWELGNISFKKLLLLLNERADDDHALVDFKFKEGSVAIRDVAFDYDHHTVHLDDFTIKKGEITLITGPTGSGKTTLLKLFAGLYLPTKGEVLYDDQSTKDVNKKSLRKSVSFIPEDWPMHGKTVFDTISYSRKKEKREKAAEVLTKIQASFSEKNRLTLDTQIGEMGVKLCKGDRKLLAYGRALLSDKPILIIDEPFSGLDDASSALILDLINNMMPHKTIIVFDKAAESGLLKPDQIIELGAGVSTSGLFYSESIH